jgi:rhodanese-related sulfurtransferase
MTTANERLPMEITPREVKAAMDAGEDIFLLDCRETEEHARASIGAAELFPMSEIQKRVAELGPQRDRHVVVHCHLGGRSLQVTHWLREQGFAHAQSMAGGIDAWSEKIDSAVPRY